MALLLRFVLTGLTEDEQVSQGTKASTTILINKLS